jgi:hypothetical protein
MGGLIEIRQVDDERIATPLRRRMARRDPEQRQQQRAMDRDRDCGPKERPATHR